MTSIYNIPQKGLEKMKKKYLIISISILLVLSTCLYVFTSDNTEKVVISSNKESNRSVVNTNALTMMYETGYQSGEYQVASDTAWPQDGYIFNETLSRCENGGTLTWNSETNKVVMQTNSSDRCYVYFDKELSLAEVCSGKTFAECITTEVYTTDGDNGLYLHDTDLANGAQDNSYRYSGANPNNYVCFGATGADCQNEENQYRIIGVFNGQVKLIKATSYGDYAWDRTSSDTSNTWDGTTKPDIYTTLNTTYYNTLGSEWQNLIAETTWQVGGFNYSDLGTAKETYDLEVGTGQSGYVETMKIGLMYVSDYGYGASPEKWTTELYNYEPTVYSNWMYLGYTEWTVSRYSDDSDFTYNAFSVDNAGYVSHNFVGSTLAVRPSFYLESDVTYASGSGSMTDPLKIN